MPIEDGLPNIPLEGGTVNTSHATNTVPSSSTKSPSQQYISTIDDSKLLTVISSISSTPSTTSPVYSPISSPRSPSSSSMDGISILHKRSRGGSISSHSSGSDTDDDERATKRHQSDSDVDSVASDETRTHEPIVTCKYGEHAIRVLTIEDGSRVVVAKDFLLLTGISKENCARTTKNLIEGKDKRMMHVPSSYCMNKGQQAVVLTTSGLSQLLVTSRRLKQSAALQAWIKQTLMPALQGHATATATSTNSTATDIHMQSQSQAHNKTNTNIKSKNGRTIVKAKRSVASNKSPSASPVIKAAPAPLALSPTTSSFSPFIRSPSSSSSSASSSPIRPTFSRLSSSDSESTMSDASTSSSTPSSPASSSSGMQELSAAADMMLITPTNPIKPLPMHFPMSMSMPMPFVPTFSRMPLYRTPLMPLPTMSGMGIRPTFTAGKIWAAGA